MTTTWIRDAFGVDVQHRNNWSCCDDGFGNLIEAAGSYYKEHPTAPMLHKDMQIVNFEGAIYYWTDGACNNWYDPPKKHNPYAAIDFIYSLSMKQWPQHGYKLIHENGGEYWTQDYRCAKPDKYPANRRSKALQAQLALLKERNEL
jgi:hypothetical protein